MTDETKPLPPDPDAPNRADLARAVGRTVARVEFVAPDDGDYRAVLHFTDGSQLELVANGAYGDDGRLSANFAEPPEGP